MTGRIIASPAGCRRLARRRAVRGRAGRLRGARAPVQDPAPGTSYYLSLGDSLAQGVQADPFGHVGPTDHGYPDQLYGLIRRHYQDLVLVKLGCPGETTKTMIHGQHCPYPDGSQLAQAVAFLRHHRGHVPLLTIDIGANDRRSCFTDPVHAAVPPCATGVAAPTAANLALILSRLRAAAGAGDAHHRHDVLRARAARVALRPRRPRAGLVSEQLSVAFDAELAAVYRSSGDRVADVTGAFATTDFAGRVPSAAHRPGAGQRG